MSARTAYLSKLFGLFIAIFGASWLLNPGGINEAMTAAMHDKGLMWTYGFTTMLGGLAVVIGHNIWRGWQAIVVTLLGWAGLLKGVVLLVVPNSAMLALYDGFNVLGLPLVYGIVMIALGGGLAYGGFRSPRAA